MSAMRFPINRRVAGSMQAAFEKPLPGGLRFAFDEMVCGD